jgi:pimeloyl-ACP methyl ester carboxylesterase
MLAIDLTGPRSPGPSGRTVGHDWEAAVVWATAMFAPVADHLAALSVGHPSAFAGMSMAQRQKSWYMLLFQYAGHAEDWLSRDGWANFREWCHHPDADAVIAELEANESLTPALNYYRATMSPEALTGPPMEFPHVQAPTMGVWSSNDFALLEQQMTDSANFVASTFRYERIDGHDHWMQWEAPDKVNALLLDFLPR